MKHLLLALTFLAPNTGLLGMFKKLEQAKTWSYTEHAFYAARACAPSAVSAAAAVASLFLVSKVEGSYTKIGVGFAGNALGLSFATYTKHLIAEKEQKDEVTSGTPVPYSVNNPILRHLPTAVSALGCFGIAVQTLYEQKKTIREQKKEIDTLKASALCHSSALLEHSQIIDKLKDAAKEKQEMLDGLVEKKTQYPNFSTSKAKPEDSDVTAIEMLRRLQEAAHTGAPSAKIEAMAKAYIIELLPSK